MKIKLLIASLLLVGLHGPLFASEGKVVRLSEPVIQTQTHEIFGAPLPEGGSPLGVAELIEHSERYEGQDVLVSTRIAKVCQKKGCFFVAQHGADTVRVTFKDYGFFIPSDSGGKNVTLAGHFSRKPLTPEEAAHLSADLGEAAGSVEPGWEYAIVATSVSIPR